MQPRKGQVLLGLGLGLVALLGLVGVLAAAGQGATNVAAAPERATAGTVTETLMILYQDTDGDNWTDNDGWGTGDPYCTWYGVTCIGGELTNISLRTNNLTGTIPPELGALSTLRYLNLSSNYLSGGIPPALRDLGSLRILYLYDNDLSGPIPPELGYLGSLEHLYLYDNDLSGAIPPELGALSTLQALYLYGNQLSGGIPPELEALSTLYVLDLHDNPLGGTIPPELGALNNLRSLRLDDNDLTGPVPASLGGLSNLEFLYLADNALSGGIPPELGGLSNLKALYLEGNHLSGAIPPELGALSNLDNLWLSDNDLTSPVPAELADLSSLWRLRLSGNPDLSCWQTEDALAWAVGLSDYFGPEAVCFCVDWAATGADSGVSWADAFTELQSALAVTLAVPGAGVEIWVAEGLYTPDYDPDLGGHTGAAAATFVLTDGVALYGGFDPGSGIVIRDQRDPAVHVTVLSGDLDHNDTADANGVVTVTANITGTNAWTVVTAGAVDETVVLDGFTITAGDGSADAEACEPDEPCHNGGGMVVLDGKPTVTGVTFSGNRAMWSGGGMYTSNGRPALTNVAFSGNSAISGGGMCNRGSSPTLINVRFSENWGVYHGGGMFNTVYSSPMLVNVAFRNNSAVVYRGGGMSNWASSPTVINATFSGNSADGEYGRGGAMDNRDGSSPTLINSILWGNSAPIGAQIANDASSSTINYCLVQDGCPDGATCDSNLLTADPLFADAAAGDLRLQPGSPAIDAGDDTAVPPEVTTDLAGRPRIVGSVVDLGVYETQPPVYLPVMLR